MSKYIGTLKSEGLSIPVPDLEFYLKSGDLLDEKIYFVNSWFERGQLYSYEMEMMRGFKFEKFIKPSIVEFSYK